MWVVCRILWHIPWYGIHLVLNSVCQFWHLRTFRENLERSYVQVGRRCAGGCGGVISTAVQGILCTWHMPEYALEPYLKWQPFSASHWCENMHKLHCEGSRKYGMCRRHDQHAVECHERVHSFGWHRSWYASVSTRTILARTSLTL